MGKWYINNSKTKEKPILFFEFLNILRDKLESMIGRAAILGRDAVRWQVGCAAILGLDVVRW